MRRPWIPHPRTFVSTHPEPEVENFRAFLSFDALPYLVVCLYAFPDRIPDFISQLTNDRLNPGPDKEDEAEKAVAALVEISTLLRTSGKSLDSYLEKKHGEKEFPKTNRAGVLIGITPNPPYHAERFALTRHVGFDLLKKSFFLYDPISGLWLLAPQEELRALASRYWKEYADEKAETPEVRARLLAMRTTGFLDGFLKLVAGSTYFFPSSEPPILLHAKNKMVGIGRNESNREFSPAFFSRTQIPVDYVDSGKSAECPDFLEFLNGVLTPDDVELLQKWSGSLVMGVNLFQRILLITGAGGTGKSVFALIIEGIIGASNCIELRAANLGDRFEQGRFIGKSLLLGLDVPMDFLSSPGAAHLKKLTGNDSISPEVKGSKDIPRIKGIFNVLITSNVRPKLRLQADREAWKRRLMHIEFKLSSTRRRMDREFAQNLLRKESSGILRWMIAGARKLRMLKNEKRDWELTLEQAERVDAILNEADSLRSFLGTMIEEVKEGDKSSTLTTQELYDAYSLFCDSNNWIPLTYGQINRGLPSLMIELFKSKPRTDIKRQRKNGKEGNQRGYARVRLKGARKSPTQPLHTEHTDSV